MEINTRTENGNIIAMVKSKDMLITDVQSALDLIATVGYEADSNRIILDKETICEDFFDLKTRLAGEILQKFINYHTKIAIVGDVTAYSSNSLRDFIYECNQGTDIFFVQSEDEAIHKLSSI
ncbi:DUF4180 domain-containing protein [Paenibacillus sp. SN-8-1]|uniref:DUF4180 domain-containing protein n=1 Tax=Paenibacillus sp. SN-8-1 TaxID=3435409 RepID=UPI003D9A33E4